RVIGSHLPWGDTNIYFDTAGCCGATQRIAASITDDEMKGSWNHIAYVKNGSTLNEVYVNGTLLVDSAGNEMAALSEINQFTIGASFGGGASYAGMYDEFAMWNTALTPDQIADLAGGAEVPGAVTIRGDFDNNGSIGTEDYEIMATNLGSHLDLPGAEAHSRGDYDLNGTIDLVDFGAFKADFPGVVAAATGVPEPSTVVLSVFAISGLSLLVGRRRS
ncbi:MAG: LamG domain-containing protein, partial [Planctomycetota bacterium]